MCFLAEGMAEEGGLTEGFYFINLEIVPLIGADRLELEVK